MPYKKTYKRKRKRKYFKKRRYKRKTNRISFRKLTNISPDCLYTKLIYTETINKSGSINWAHVFSMNSCFDPNITGTGHQPLGFDQYSALYTHYEVMGSKMVVKVINDSSSVNALAALAPSTSTINPGFSVLTEQKYSQNKYLNNSTGGHNLAYMKKYMSPRKLLGRQTNSLNYAAAVSSNPVNQTYWIVSGQALDGISSTSLHIFVRITYYCKFWNRVQLGQS